MHIGLFDSGLGGLTILRALQAKLPTASFTYLGDTARMPYGEKTPDTLLQFAESNLQFLLRHSIDMLVIACCTASAWTLHPLRSRHPLPMIGTIETESLAASKATRCGRIGILATRATIASKSYEKHLKNYAPHVECFSIAAPLLVPLIEEGLHQHPATKLLLKDYLAPFKEARIDTLLLGCTHYPLLLSWIAEEMGEEVTIIDPAESCAQRCVQDYVLQRREEHVGHNHLGHNHLGHPHHTKPPFQRFFVSQDVERFQRLGSAILGYELPHIELCTLSGR